jgi:hypothetical protein
LVEYLLLLIVSGTSVYNEYEDTNTKSILKEPK